MLTELTVNSHGSAHLNIPDAVFVFPIHSYCLEILARLLSRSNDVNTLDKYRLCDVMIDMYESGDRHSAMGTTGCLGPAKR
jgi:hypothetical protein